MLSNDKNKSYSDEVLCDLAYKTVKYLVSVWGAEVNVEFSNRLRRKCYCTQKENGKSRIVFGVETLHNVAKYGQRYDKELGVNAFGLRAVVAISAHEYAHAVMHDYGWKYESHGKEWAEAYLDMMKDLDKLF